ncbi:hypothetical protein CDES_14450 (plasmid) [Corynebacterium deserti GIMN1.010]|uniref:Uncharacterized protein n=1 Tax=Corynebacterium deserti GIMN1.010 TaxID=931089 RepID=A0A0M4CKQ6_9CORY|nr:hypothetical protein CDES_14450 [Corynebacterium deserti GIMN1.010]
MPEPQGDWLVGISLDVIAHIDKVAHINHADIGARWVFGQVAGQLLLSGINQLLPLNDAQDLHISLRLYANLVLSVGVDSRGLREGDECKAIVRESGNRAMVGAGDRANPFSRQSSDAGDLNLGAPWSHLHGLADGGVETGSRLPLLALCLLMFHECFGQFFQNVFGHINMHTTVGQCV